MRFKQSNAIRWLILLVLWLSTKVSAVHRMPPPGLDYTNQFNEVNHIDHLSDNNGGCRRNVARIAVAWREMLSMINAGWTAADKIANQVQEPQPPANVANYRDYEEWLKLTQPFRALFGQPANFDELKARAKQVKEVYWTLILRTRVREGPAHGPRFYIKCNDDWIQYKPSTFKDPRDIGTPNQDRFTIGEPDPNIHDREAFPHGAYCFPGMPPDLRLYWDEERSNAQDQHRFCKPGEFVTSIPKLRMVIFCPPSFTAPASWSMATVENGLQDRDAIDDPTHANNGAMLWMKELFEYGFQMEGSEDLRPTNTWRESMQLAKRRPGDTVKSPEAYVFYAATMYWNRWWWGTGRASRHPEAEPWNPHSGKSGDSDDDDDQGGGKGKGKGKAPIRKFKEKCKEIKEKCERQFKPGGGGSGKKGQSSTNPNGRRALNPKQRAIEATVAAEVAKGVGSSQSGIASSQPGAAKTQSGAANSPTSTANNQLGATGSQQGASSSHQGAANSESEEEPTCEECGFGPDDGEPSGNQASGNQPSSSRAVGSSQPTGSSEATGSSQPAGSTQPTGGSQPQSTGNSQSKSPSGPRQVQKTCEDIKDECAEFKKCEEGMKKAEAKDPDAANLDACEGPGPFLGGGPTCQSCGFDKSPSVRSAAEEEPASQSQCKVLEGNCQLARDCSDLGRSVDECAFNGLDHVCVECGFMKRAS